MDESAASTARVTAVFPQLLTDPIISSSADHHLDADCKSTAPAITAATSLSRPTLPRLSPECRLLIYNVAKRANIGQILRTGVAFGVSEVIIIGEKNKVSTFGCQGTRSFVNFVRYPTLQEAVDQLRRESFTIIGIEICDSAVPVHLQPFVGNTCFIFGNEGTGLNDKAMRACDAFVYIPQVGPGTASLNVAAAAAIVLHQFALWAKYVERERRGQKFIVAEAPRDPMAPPRRPHAQHQASVGSGARSEDSIGNADNADGSASDLHLLGMSESSVAEETVEVIHMKACCDTAVDSVALQLRSGP